MKAFPGRPAQRLCAYCDACYDGNGCLLHARGCATRQPPTPTTETILAERGKTHGDYTKQAKTAMDLRGPLTFSEGWSALTAVQQDALYMITVKMSRIVNGNPNERDHWADIAGYATLAAERCGK